MDDGAGMDGFQGKVGLSERNALEMGKVLRGTRLGRLRTASLFTGPAVIASIAYMDPGNFATNIQAGARYGYSLLWVVALASALAMLFQALSAKLGIVTGRNLAELSRDHLPRPLVLAMWVVSEIAAMATDLAEFLGGAIGLSLLLNVSLFSGMVATAVITYAILLTDRRGFRPLELVIGAFVCLIALCYLTELIIAPVSWQGVALGTILPRLPDSAAVTIAVGIVGATVMPHALYLHSGLTQSRVAAPTDLMRRMLIRFSNREVLIALTLAGLVNMAMVVMAASAFHAGHSDVAEIETAYHSLTPLLGGAAATVFLVSLLASGVSSSVVGTMAGQMVMQGFVGFRIPIWLRRVITMVPALVVVALGVNPTETLVYSQVVLSLVLPIPMIALIWLTRRRDVMGAFANSTRVHVLAIACAVVILALNVILLLQMAGIDLVG